MASDHSLLYIDGNAPLPVMGVFENKETGEPVSESNGKESGESDVGVLGGVIGGVAIGVVGWVRGGEGPELGVMGVVGGDAGGVAGRAATG